MESKNTGKQVAPSNTSEPSVDPSILQEEGKKLYLMSVQGKHKQATQLILRACDQHKDSAFLHHVQGEVFRLAALANKNPELVQVFHRKAMESAQDAVSLDQNSIRYSTFYLMFLLHEKRFQEVVQEGERALAIENPIDPATQDFDVPESNFKTPEERIHFLVMSIRELVEQCRNPLGKTRKQIRQSVKQAQQKFIGERVPVKHIPNYPNVQLNEEQRMIQESIANLTDSEKLLRVWNSLSLGQKLDFLKVDVGDLLNSTKHISEKKVLSEAITFYKQNADWKFWRCCCCNEKFLDSESHLEHVEKIHMEQILPEKTPILPEQLEEKWVRMIVQGTWKPIYAIAVITAVEEKWEQCKLYQGCSDRVEWAEKYLLQNNWPSKYHRGRILALNHIQWALKLLLQDHFLSAVHMNTLIGYSKKRLEGLLRGTEVWKQGLAQTHLCICSLDMSDFENIINFLNDILKASQRIASVKNPTIHEHLTTVKALPPDITEKIFLNENLICLLPDASVPSILDSNSSRPNDDAILQWIFTGQLREGLLEKWKRLEEERSEQGIEVLMTQNGNILSLKDLYIEKTDLSRSVDAIKAVWDAFKERKYEEEHDHQSFETILRKQQKEILQHQIAQVESPEYDAEMDRLKLGFISAVLNEAQSKDYVQEKILAPIQPQVCDFRNFKDLDEADARVKDAMLTVEKSISLEDMKTDMKVTRTLHESWDLDKMITSLAARDYRTILLPLIKSYILVKLEREANKDIAEKSAAVRIANQTFVPDTNTQFSRGGNQSKQQQQKNKNRTGPKISKVNEPSQTDKIDQIVPPDVDTDNNPERDDMGASDDADLKQQEERIRCEEEEEERKLQEKLRRYQKRMDEQSKAHLVQKEREAAQQAETAGLAATIRASTASAAAGGSSSIVRLHSASESEVPQLLASRREAAMQSYKNPSTESSERPIMYSSEPGLEHPVRELEDFLATFPQEMEDSPKTSLKPIPDANTEDK